MSSDYAQWANSALRHADAAPPANREFHVQRAIALALIGILVNMEAAAEAVATRDELAFNTELYKEAKP